MLTLAISLLLTGPAAASEDFAGFGGVGLGVLSYGANSALASSDGTPSRVLQSEFFFRAGESNVFVGYAVGIQGGSSFYRDFVPVDGVNPDTYGIALNDECYGEICLGNMYTEYIDVLHVPVELNTAWVFDFWKLSGYVGGGPSLHYYRVSGYASGSMVQIMDADDDLRAFYDDSDLGTGYTNGFMTSSEQTLDSKKSRKYGAGGQLVAGVQYEFGKLPLLGGRWGIALSGKAQLTQTSNYETKFKASFKEYGLDGEYLPEFSYNIKARQRKVPINGTNFGGKVGLVYFF